MEESDFPKELLKQLGDRSQDKRSIASKQIEEYAKRMISEYFDENDQIEGLITFFNVKFINNQQNNIQKKKGGIKALSSIAIAMSQHENIAKKYAIKITDPLIKELSDNKTRFEAVEALYFVSQAFQSVILINFNPLFDRLVDKLQDFDEEFKRAAQQLDTTLKGIIIQSLPETYYFNFKKFMPILCQKAKAQSPVIRRAILSWINTFDQIPCLNILDYLPEFLEDLFNMLGDQNKDIFNQAQSILKEFLNEIRERESAENYIYEDVMDSQQDQNRDNFDIHPPILEILVSILGKKEKKTSLVKKRALEWIQEYLKIYLFNIEYYNEQNKQQIENIKEESKELEENSQLQQSSTQKKDKVGKAIVNKISQIIISNLNCMSHEQEEIRKTAIYTDELLQKITDQAQNTHIDVEEIMISLKDLLILKRGYQTAENCLVWMGHLLDSSKNSNISKSIEDILQILIDMLYKGELVQYVLDVLGKISLKDKYFDRVIEKILNVLYQSREQLQKNCDLIVKKLCSTGDQDSRKVFQTFANKLQNYEDNEFVATFVQSLDTILLTDRQLEDLRNLLKNMKFDEEKKEKSQQLFEKLFFTWCYNPVSTITLCFLGQQYELAYKVIMKFQEIEIDTEILIQISKLINFLESTHFVYLRLSLLEHQQHPYLMKSLLGLLMLMPQGKAFHILNQRLKTAQLDQNSLCVQQECKAKIQLDIDKLLKVFQNRQSYLKRGTEVRPSKASSLTYQRDINLV